MRFRIDWTGGWETYGHTIWRTFGNQCRPYDGPPLAYVVAACKAPDGSYWALQRWQRKLAAPRLSAVDVVADRLGAATSRTGPAPLAQLELYADWAFDGEAHDLFGR